MRRLVFALFTVFVASGCLCSGCLWPSSYGYKDWQEYRSHEFEYRKEKAQPVIDALEAYKTRHGKYPTALNDLVSEKLIQEVPDLADNNDHQGQAGRVEKAGGLQYTVTDSGYVLSFNYSFVEQAFTSSKDRWEVYSPVAKKWSPAWSADLARQAIANASASPEKNAAKK